MESCDTAETNFDSPFVGASAGWSEAVDAMVRDEARAEGRKLLASDEIDRKDETGFENNLIRAKQNQRDLDSIHCPKRFSLRKRIIRSETLLKAVDKFLELFSQ